MTWKIGPAGATHSVIVASIALAFGLADAQQSFAGCGGYCEAQQARAICHQAVKDQELKAHERDAEFERCKADPVSSRSQTGSRTTLN